MGEQSKNKLMNEYHSFIFQLQIPIEDDKK